MRDEKAARKMSKDGQRGLHIKVIFIKINKPVKSLNKLQYNQSNLIQKNHQKFAHKKNNP